MRLRSSRGSPASEQRIDLLVRLTSGYTHAAFTGMYDTAYPASTADAVQGPYTIAPADQSEDYVAFFPPQLSPFARAVVSLGNERSIRTGDPTVSVPLTAQALPPSGVDIWLSQDNYIVRTGPKTLLAVRQSKAPAVGDVEARSVDQFFLSTNGGDPNTAGKFAPWASVDGKDVTVSGSQPWKYPSATGKSDAGVDYPTLYVDPFTGNTFFTTGIKGRAANCPSAACPNLTSPWNDSELLFRANSVADLKTPITDEVQSGGNMTSVPSGRLFTSAKCAIGSAYAPADVFLFWLERADLVPHADAKAPSVQIDLNALSQTLPQCVTGVCSPGGDPAVCKNDGPALYFKGQGAAPSYIGQAQVSRVGSYPVGDVVRVAYPAVVPIKTHNVFIEQIVTLLIDYQSPPHTTILSIDQILPSDTSSGRGFVGQFTFVETDQLDLGSAYSGNTTLAYWRDGAFNTITHKLMEKIRFNSVRGLNAWSYTQDATTAWDQSTDSWWGDQLAGGFFYDSTVGSNGALTFVPMWTQPNAAGSGNELRMSYVRYPW